MLRELDKNGVSIAILHKLSYRSSLGCVNEMYFYTIPGGFKDFKDNNELLKYWNDANVLQMN